MGWGGGGLGGDVLGPSMRRGVGFLDRGFGGENGRERTHRKK